MKMNSKFVRETRKGIELTEITVRRLTREVWRESLRIFIESESIRAISGREEYPEGWRSKDPFDMPL